ncbi:hypothetical protein MVI27_01685 [Chryseobacterium salipaludis]|uniref:hypothetical protein n=1 Tax=Chryseobacterium TaxID=59732 RepID=UPI001FF46F6C|nr:MULTISPECIES: hypothetical protein [Chryseobacterium]MCJ8496968.1 hypothetical protein [Chryseobacterium salipaludis]MCX3296449.1 hypothetical protein [Planobacterium sp. JC490]
MESIYTQLFAAFALAIPVACVAWTVTHEEIFREPREYCVKRSQNSATLLKRKFFYLFTCEYCFSHYVTAFFLIVTGFKLYFEDWRGYLLSFFTVVYIANLYMSLFGFLRQNLKAEKIEAKLKDTELKEVIKEKENK